MPRYTTMCGYTVYGIFPNREYIYIETSSKAKLLFDGWFSKKSLVSWQIGKVFQQNVWYIL